MQGGMQMGAMQFGGQGMKRRAQSMGGGFAKKQAVETMSTGAKKKGMVKSFNTGKGFGFISAAGVSGDVFFMKSALPAQAQENRDLSGQGVRFELATTMDGKMR